MRRIVLIVLLAVTVFHLTLSPIAGMDREKLQQVKRDTELFSTILEEVLKQHFDNPFALSVEPQGSYLEGYGLSISFLLRINRGSIRGIYGAINYPESNRNQELSKEEKLELVKKITCRTLVDYGGTIKGLEDDQRVSISAHIEDRNEWNREAKMTIIVVSGLKKEINRLSKGDFSDQELRRQLTILEY